MKYEHSNLYQLVGNAPFTPDNALITGVTGFLGSHFVFWKLQVPGKLYLLVRAENQDAGWQRIIDSLSKASESYQMQLPSIEVLRERIVCVLGDMLKPNCGVNSIAMDELVGAEINQIWHCAADMGFLPKHRDRLIRTNVHGTEALMNVGKLISIDRFVYISTAYTAGDKQYSVVEDCHDGSQKFANSYEESKFLTEQVVASFCEANDLDWNILRPSIIMGPLEDKKSGGTRFGGYGFVEGLFDIREILTKVNQKIRLEIPSDTTLNLISVDQVVYDMLYLRSIEFGEKNVYHLASGSLLNSRDTMRSFERAIGVEALEFVDTRESSPTSLELVFDKGTEFHKGYYYSTKVFERSLPEHAQEFDIELLDECMSNFVEELIAEEKVKETLDFESREVASWDGQRIQSYARGEESSPPVMFINAYGMPLQFAVPLSRIMSKTHRFITWDSRWVPDTTQPFEEEKCNSLTHVKDLIAVLDEFGIEQCALVGWSSGAQVCLRALAEFPDRFSCGVLLNSGVSLATDSVIETEYQQSLRSLFPKIAGNRSAAKLYCDLIYGDTTKVGLKDQGSIGSMLNSLDPELMNMTSAPFKNPESLYRYANMLYRNFEEDDAAFTDQINLPVLVYGSEEDEVTHVDVAKELSKRLSNSELILATTATHFAQYSDVDVGEMVVDYIQKHAQSLPLIGRREV